MSSRRLPAVITVEAAVVMGVVLMGLALLFRMSLYLHDKAVLSGVVLETAQAAKERDRAQEEGAAGGYFYTRIGGKLLYFSRPSCTVSQTEESVTVTAQAGNGRLRLRAKANAPLTIPEEKIRERMKGGE